jgi:aminoglycoside phosphotransferase (APT) family kinase protein
MPPSNPEGTQPDNPVERIVADLERHLRRRVLKLEPMAEGHSGWTYRVQFEGEQGILRLPAAGVRIAGPADVVRQGRIMAALHAAGVPAPAIISMADEPVVDGRPFVLMQAVAGERIERVRDVVPQADIALSAVGVLTRIHGLPTERTGIGDEEPRTLPQEVQRWSWLLERSPPELTARAPALAGRLLVKPPAERPPGLVHGDFHYGNLLFDGSRVTSVLDWEIAQVGQPLIDLGCLLLVSAAARSADPEIAISVPGAGAVEVPDEVVVGAYGQVSQEEVDWYVALNFYKLAAILGYNLMLHRRGKRPDPIYETRTETIRKFIDEGLQRLG